MVDLKNACKEFINTAVAKFKDLKDPQEIGKCIRTLFVTGCIGYSVSTVIKNGGINYKNKLMIGNVQNKALLEDK